MPSCLRTYGREFRPLDLRTAACELQRHLAQNAAASVAGNLFADIAQTPAGQTLTRQLESGGVLSCNGVSLAAQPYFAALLQKISPDRFVLVVTENLKAQESFQQDLETWLGEMRSEKLERRNLETPSSPLPQLTLFYPAWEILPHEGKLPHADTITDRLQTLLALVEESNVQNPKPKVVVTSVAALLQKTFAPDELKNRTRQLKRGDHVAPLDLVERLEEQGYEPEAQVTQKGEIALRGGILDIFPPTSPWPVRLEFFGDELESLRYFDPLTQISREEISAVALPPAGEVGILNTQIQKSENRTEGLATLLDYFPRESILMLCNPEELALRSEEYAKEIPAHDAFFISWKSFLEQAASRGFVQLSLGEGDELSVPIPGSEARTPVLSSLDAFRPLGERAPDLQIAEAQRREFFEQLHRWLRQGYAVHVFCNNDGERQRFQEIWAELGLEVESSLRLEKSAHRADAAPQIHLGSLARGFLCDEAKLVVVTDAEIFGRYKIQRPRRLKTSHASAMRSALEIDFADLEEGDMASRVILD